MATTSTTSIAGLGSSYATQAGTTATDATAGALNSNSFLTMFLTQLKCQDPTNPLESYELTAQLAQFSTVEKLTQQTTLLNNLQNYASAMNNAEIASMVGKNVKAQMSTVDVGDNSVGALSYKLDSPAGVTVTVSDSNGNVVYSTSKGSQAAGTYSVDWDGKNASGARVSNGTYTVKVQAVDATSGDVSTLGTFAQGVVYSCNLDGTPTYQLTGSDGTRIAVSNVYDVSS